MCSVGILLTVLLCVMMSSFGASEVPTINCQPRIVKFLKNFSLRLNPPYGKVEKGGMETKLMNSWLWSRVKAIISEIYELLLVEQIRPCFQS